MAEALFNSTWNVEQMAYLLDEDINNVRILGDKIFFPETTQNDFDSFIAGYSPQVDWIRPDLVVPTMQRNRQAAYSAEADPLFFQWQRNEGTEQAWLNKVAEIRDRYPYTET